MGASGVVTPELRRNVQDRYEWTDESVRSIAADSEVAERTIYKWIEYGGWRRRRDRPPRDVPPELQLNLDIDRALEEAETATSAAEECDANPRPNPHPDRLRCATAIDPPHKGEGDGGEAIALGPDRAAAEPVDMLAIAERLERQLEQNLARVERLRETQWPQSTADAERTTRALERLTEALLKVRRLRNPETNTADRDEADRNDLDIPRDIDEFRRRFAQRIRAFVRSRTGGSVSQAGDASGAA